MPYVSGETPKKGDQVRDVNDGRPGIVNNVQLDSHHTGEDVVGVQWDDGGVGVGMALAREFVLSAPTAERP
jgi:hypothetical protein